MLSYPNSLILRQAKNISTSYINPTSESHKLRNRKHRYKYPLELWSRNQRGMGQKHLAQWGLTCSPYGPEPIGPMISTQILKNFEKNSLSGSWRTSWFMQFDGLTVGLNGSTPIRSKNGSTKVTGPERPPIDDPILKHCTKSL